MSCTEPAICPAIRAPRTWEQADFLAERAAASPAIAELATFVCAQYAAGIGVVPASALREALARFTEALRGAQEARSFWVATVSACHGALGQLRVSPAAYPSRT